MHRHRKAKIVATLGPASSSPEMFARCSRPARTCSASTSATARTRTIRRATISSARWNARPAARSRVLADLQGPKLRVGTFAEGPVKLRDRQAFRLDLDATPGDRIASGCRIPRSSQALKPGVELLLDDGKVRLVVECLRAEIAPRPGRGAPAPLSDRKGVNVAGVVLPISALTDKDRRGPRIRARHGRRLGRAVLRAAAGGHGGGARAWSATRRCHGEAGEAVGDRQPRRDRRALRRRSWWRAATSAWRCRPRRCR